LEKAAIIRVLHEEPAFYEMFLSHLLARTIRVEEDLVDQLFNSSEKRLARALLLLANFGKEGRPEAVIAKASQETLAELIGTTRSRVSFFMNRFRKMGLINYNGHLEIHSSLLNVVLHDDPHINRHGLASAAGVLGAGSEPLCQGAVLLEQEKSPRQLDHAPPNPRIPGSRHSFLAALDPASCRDSLGGRGCSAGRGVCGPPRSGIQPSRSACRRMRLPADHLYVNNSAVAASTRPFQQVT
jgi:hypothetical protein